MTDFDQRLRRAIERGERTGTAREEAEAERRLSEQELRRLHGEYRLELTEHIDRCLEKLPQHFPGFEVLVVVNDRGWGSVVSRDDLAFGPQRDRISYFSRLEVMVRPVSEYLVLEVVAKATVRNKELFNRSHFQRLTEVDLATFFAAIDQWVLEFAERYAAAR